MLSLDDRSKFESLATEYANASMDLVRATSRRHDALHRMLDYVNSHEAGAADAAVILDRSSRTPEGLTLAVDDRARELLSEALHLAAMGDIDENTEAHGWGDFVKRAQTLLESQVTVGMLADIAADGPLLPDVPIISAAGANTFKVEMPDPVPCTVLDASVAYDAIAEMLARAGHVKDCLCVACNDARALKRVGK